MVLFFLVSGNRCWFFHAILESRIAKRGEQNEESVSEESESGFVVVRSKFIRKKHISQDASFIPHHSFCK